MDVIAGNGPLIQEIMLHLGPAAVYITPEYPMTAGFRIKDGQPGGRGGYGGTRGRIHTRNQQSLAVAFNIEDGTVVRLCTIRIDGHALCQYGQREQESEKGKKLFHDVFV